MKHLFGPVPSRRLGLSLGIDIIPHKTCTLSCIYCQIGRTPVTTIERREYVPVDEVLAEVRRFVDSGRTTDWLTFSGSGEPTLHSGIGGMIDGVKAMTDKPVCVITNGTLLWDPQVRRDIRAADAVMPSLDSAVQETFDTITRPYPGLDVGRIIDGLADFRAEYSGTIWLEILFVAGLNDSPRELEALRAAVGRIRPDRVHLNTVVRPPAESVAMPLPPERLEEIRRFFGESAEVVASFRGEAPISGTGIEGVREYLKRRPGRTEDIAVSLGIPADETERLLGQLARDGEARVREHYGKRFWEYASG